MQSSDTEGAPIRRSLDGSVELRWRNQLASLVESASDSSPLAIVGVGNRLLADDGIGSWIALRLRKRLPERLMGKIHVWDAGSLPEASLTDVVRLRPKSVLFIDSTDMDLAPGSVRLVDIEKTVFPVFATHNIPLKVLRAFFPPETPVFLLGIQPLSMELESGMSAVAERAVDEVLRVVCSAIC